MANTRSVPPAQDAMWILILLGCPPDEHPYYSLLGTLALPAGGDMRLILNVVWLIFGGLWMAVGYVLAALLSFLLIITIPFGFASLRIASYTLWPFGRTIVDKPTAGTGALIGNVVWVLLFGIWLAIGHLTSA